jgi:hypothetical protein
LWRVLIPSLRAQAKQSMLPPSKMDCFVRFAPRNDVMTPRSRGASMHSNDGADAG